MGTEMLAQQGTEAQHLQGTATLCPVHSSPRDPLAGLSPSATATKTGPGHNWGCPKVYHRVLVELKGPARGGRRGHGCSGTAGAEGRMFNFQLLPPEPSSLQAGIEVPIPSWPSLLQEDR